MRTVRQRATTHEGPGPSEAMRRYVNGETTPTEYLRETRKEAERDVEEHRSTRREEQNGGSDRSDDAAA